MRTRIRDRREGHTVLVPQLQGSDQVAMLGDRQLGKPGNHKTAKTQLINCSGQKVRFYTAVAVICESRDYLDHHVEQFFVRFRSLSEKTVENYLRRDQPYDCAGSFKSEGLGIALFSAMSGDDPTGLQGLPLIALTSMLREAGLDVLD